MGEQPPVETVSGRAGSGISVRSGSPYRIQVLPVRIGDYVLERRHKLDFSNCSGIAWRPPTNTLLVVRNHPKRVTLVELDLDANVVSESRCDGVEDVEDLVYLGEGGSGPKLLLAEERLWNVRPAEVVGNALRVGMRWNFSGGEDGDNDGLEALGYDPETRRVFLGREAPPEVWSVVLDGAGPRYTPFELEDRVGPEDKKKVKNRPDDVRAVQGGIRQYFPDLAGPWTDGEADWQTLAAIKELQRLNGLKPNGVVKPGRATHRLLMGLTNHTPVVLDSLHDPPNDLSALGYYQGRMLLLSDESAEVIEVAMNGVGELSRLSLEKDKDTGLKKDVPQAEGLCLDGRGWLYVCSEGKKNNYLYVFRPPD